MYKGLEQAFVQAFGGGDRYRCQHGAVRQARDQAAEGYDDAQHGRRPWRTGESSHRPRSWRLANQ